MGDSPLLNGLEETQYLLNSICSSNGFDRLKLVDMFSPEKKSTSDINNINSSIIQDIDDCLSNLKDIDDLIADDDIDLESITIVEFNLLIQVLSQTLKRTLLMNKLPMKDLNYS